MGAVYLWELRKLRSQKRTYLGLGGAVLVPIAFVIALAVQKGGAGPNDVPLARALRDTGLAIPFVVLFFMSIWGLPLVGEDAVKQAAFRDGKAKYNDIVWWPKGGGWKNQSPTPNVNTRYMYFFINTRQDGPVVVELPQAVPGASFYGTIEDAWYVPLTDIGFEGKGGKYLVLPPDFKGDVPDGYIAVRPATSSPDTIHGQRDHEVGA